MTAVPALQALARLDMGDPEHALAQLLGLVRELLGMDVAFVSAIDAGHRHVRAARDASGATADLDRLVPAGPLWGGRVLAEGGLLLGDVRTRPDLAALESTAACRIVSFAGVPLLGQDGAPFGVLCAYGHSAHSSLNSRDVDVLNGLAEVIAPLVETPRTRARSAPALPALEAVAQAVGAAHDVEHLTRPLLEALADLTGMASTYLTVVHEETGVQEIRFARNVRPGFELPEGLFVPWEDTLCKRALEEDRPFTGDVPTTWGDSEAARDLGIQVYVSVPVPLPDGRLWGTLCAADSVQAEDAEAHLPTMRLFARLIGAQAERERALRAAREEAERDPLTGCSSRRVVGPWLDRELDNTPPGETVVVAYADLDSFKAVNDTFGHAAGDAVLADVGRRLCAVARRDDLAARIGGDEFVLAARLPRDSAEGLGDRVREALTFALTWQDQVIEVRASVGTAVADQHDGAALVALADAAMYAAKRARAGGRA